MDNADNIYRYIYYIILYYIYTHTFAYRHNIVYNEKFHVTVGVVSDASRSFLVRLAAFGSRHRAGVEAHAAACRELRACSAYRQGDSDCVSCEVLGFTWRGPVGASPVSPARAWAVGGRTRNLCCALHALHAARRLRAGRTLNNEQFFDCGQQIKGTGEVCSTGTQCKSCGRFQSEVLEGYTRPIGIA